MYWGYHIYRKKIIGITAVVAFLSLIVFLALLLLLGSFRLIDIRQQAQQRFLEGERWLGSIQGWTGSYVDTLYEDSRLLEDIRALFQAEDSEHYLQLRRHNSLTREEKIGYLPASLRKLFTNRQMPVFLVVLRSQQGEKILWMDDLSGEIHLEFSGGAQEGISWTEGFQDGVILTGTVREKTQTKSSREEASKIIWTYITKEAAPQTDGLLVASYAIREPRQLDHVMGNIDFYVQADKIYANHTGGVWAAVSLDGGWLGGSLVNAKQLSWLKEAAGREEQSGWLVWNGIKRVFFIRFLSSQCDYAYVIVVDINTLLRDNLYIILALLAALVLIDAGVLVNNHMSLRADAKFLSLIMTMLSAMEHSSFEEIQQLELPRPHRKNEYGVIAAALKDVGFKLKGYIETEYILKLKEQETEMRALQHQINPHFLYNTLETLRSKALIRGDSDTAEAIAMLGGLYRAHMHYHNGITLKEEFSLLEMYLRIMALRFGDKFVFQTELEREAWDTPTVNFWLQPLAENFFTHGFDQESEYNLLIVSGCLEESGVRVEMIDNGTGAAPEELEDIRRNMYEGNDNPNADIGLRNVYMRLRYFYQESFSMELDNNPEGGFHIIVHIPCKDSP